MKTWTTGELESLLGLGSHVLRSWEREVPFLSPARGVSGRREYSEREVLAFLRFRHLMDCHGRSIAAAREAWLAQAGRMQNATAILNEARSELLFALEACRSLSLQARKLDRFDA